MLDCAEEHPLGSNLLQGKFELINWRVRQKHASPILLSKKTFDRWSLPHLLPPRLCVLNLAARMRLERTAQDLAAFDRTQRSQTFPNVQSVKLQQSIRQ